MQRWWSSFCLVFAVGFLGVCLQISPVSASTFYSVRDGDTLASIAKDRGIDESGIRQANPNLVGSGVQPGQVLILPEAGESLDRAPAQGRVLTNADVAAEAKAQSAKRKTMASRTGRLASRGLVGLHGIISTAVRFMGVPYRWAGTTASGFDCSGFTQRVFHINGVSLPRIASDQYWKGRQVAREHLSIGDLVFFSTYGPGATHVGIYMGGGNFIHASSSHGVTISSLGDSYWAKRYFGASRP